MVLTIVIVFAMTAAWYTNIVQTSGLVFEAEAWGFEGKITVGNENIVAAPGDSGTIDLQVENEREGISNISLNVSKSEMDPRMQRRLYFYVDTPMTRNGETMDRVYLNNFEDYTYTLFSNGKLTMTEEVSNAPRLKWQWVKDVLGYYVMGQATEKVTGVSDEGETQTAKSVSVIEYLRPIEYDYDAATKFVDTSSDEVSVEIQTVNGTLKPVEYLNLLAAKDGYEGNRLEYNPIDGFYPIDVDETGYGVYAYLCSYTDVEMETAFDTHLGTIAYEDANGATLSDDDKLLLTHKAVLNVSAQTGETTAIGVSTLSALQDAIDRNTTDIIQLNSDITIPEGNGLVIPNSKKIMLDLNGKTITNHALVGVLAYPSSSLTMINGALVGKESTEKTYGIYSIGAEVTMSNVEISGFKNGVYLNDGEGNNVIDSRIRMMDCKIDGSSCAIFASGNGFLSDQKTQIIIENCELTSSTGYALSGNGDATGNGRWGTDIQILNSTLTSGITDGDNTAKAAGIYHPQQNSTLTVSDSTVTGYNGVVVKGGTVTIIDSEIMGNGEDPVAVEEGVFANSGYLDTGDAVYIETNYEYEILVTISGSSKLTSIKGESLRVHDANATNVVVTVEGGEFSPPLPTEATAESTEQSEPVSAQETQAGE